MDRILLAGIRCEMRVGVSEAERRRPQECVVDVELEGDLSRAARTDALQDTIDYEAVYNTVRRLAGQEEFQLLERFAGRLAEELRDTMGSGGLVVRVRKLHPPLDGKLDSVGIELHRS